MRIARLSTAIVSLRRVSIYTSSRDSLEGADHMGTCWITSVGGGRQKAIDDSRIRARRVWSMVALVILMGSCNPLDVDALGDRVACSSNLACDELR